MPDPLIADEGMDYIALTCSRSGAFFLPRPRQDVGIDAHIEFRDERGIPSGAIALVQCKAGLSYVSSSGKYRILADKRHFQTWSRYTLPVVGIVYNPARGDARWVNISDHLRANPACIESGPYVIEAPDHQPLSKQAFPEFQRAVGGVSVRKSAQELIDRYLTGDESTKEESLTELFSEHRWTPLAVFFICQAIRIETELSLIAYLTYLASFYRPHGDRLLGDDLCPPELQDLAGKCIGGFGVSEIIKMLSIIDEENGLERGSSGHLVVIQLHAVGDIIPKLRSIVIDQSLDDQARFYAVEILVEYLDHMDREFFRGVLEVERSAMVAEALQWALEDCALAEERPFNV